MARVDLETRQQASARNGRPGVSPRWSLPRSGRAGIPLFPHFPQLVTLTQVLSARLDALENDNVAAEQDDDSDEYVLEGDIEGAQSVGADHRPTASLAHGCL